MGLRDATRKILNIVFFVILLLFLACICLECGLTRIFIRLLSKVGHVTSVNIFFRNYKTSPIRPRTNFAVRKENIFTWFRLSSNQPLVLLNIIITSRFTWPLWKVFLKFLATFSRSELQYMAVEEKQLYLRGESKPKNEPCFNILTIGTLTCAIPVRRSKNWLKFRPRRKRMAGN